MGTNGPGRAQLDAWRALLRAHASLTTELERELEEHHGISLPMYEVLLRLDEAEQGALRLQELVGSALMTKSGVTRLVDRLEGLGLVRRQACPADRRGSYAVLTDAGRALVHEAAPTHLAGIERHFGRHLAETDAARLRDLLGLIADSLHAPRAGECGGAAGRTALTTATAD